MYLSSPLSLETQDQIACDSLNLVESDTLMPPLGLILVGYKITSAIPTLTFNSHLSRTAPDLHKDLCWICNFSTESDSEKLQSFFLPSITVLKDIH